MAVWYGRDMLHEASSRRWLGPSHRIALAMVLVMWPSAALGGEDGDRFSGERPTGEPCVARDADGWLYEVECDASGRDAPGDGSAEARSAAVSEPREPAAVDRAAGLDPNTRLSGDPYEADGFSDVPCILVPHPGCGTQPHVELGMGWGESHFEGGWQWSYRVWVEGGVLVGISRDFQVGPVFELGIDIERESSGYEGSSKLKSRYWIGGWYVSVDAAVGASFQRYALDGSHEPGTRLGPTMDVAFTVLGVLGPYVAASQLVDPAGRADTETRMLVGFRSSLAGLAVLLYPLAAATEGGAWVF